MEISNIQTRVDALNGKSSLVRRAQREETPILTLVEESADRSDEMSDPLIQALIDKLPKPNTVWSINDRGSWLKAAAMAFNLVYRLPERDEQASSVLKSVGKSVG
jgi:hypothetical protein